MKISTQKLEIVMLKQGLSLMELAELAGISRQSLSTIRKRQTCRIETAKKLCTGLRCNIEDIVPAE